MENFYSRIRNFKLPKKSELNSVIASFSKKERVLFFGLFVVLLLSTALILQNINKFFMVTVPEQGGTLSVGIVGVPRFINPILANSLADQNMVSLIYSGLLRENDDGELIPDLAEKYEMSKDGLTYTFTLKNNLYFQDGIPLTADDVLFTVNKVKDSVIKSPRKIDWDGVSAESPDKKTIVFTLKQPYASFLENTTLGIMPAHIWDNSPVLELNNANTSPVGSGPYMVDAVNKQSSGIIDSYELMPFKKFALGVPYIKKITMHFYQNETDLANALLDREVEEINSIAPLNAENLKERNYQVESAVLPRVFGLFFNQNQNQIFINKTVVNSINQVINKERIVREVLFSYGTVIDGPIPPNMTEYQAPGATAPLSREEMLVKVKNDLSKDGWNRGADGFLEKTTTDKKKKTTAKLQFSISTGNVPELTKAAEMIKKDLAEVGINVEVKVFETGNLNQDVIRPRKYDALLFGEIINHESDLFAFWHSSQRKDPGLNVAMYTSAKVDKILEDASVTVDTASRIKKYAQFADEIKKDMPAIFLYSPKFIYVVSKDLKGMKINDNVTPANRYQNAYSWYTQTQNVWKIFVK